MGTTPVMQRQKSNLVVPFCSAESIPKVGPQNPSDQSEYNIIQRLVILIHFATDRWDSQKCLDVLRKKTKTITSFRFETSASLLNVFCKMQVSFGIRPILGSNGKLQQTVCLARTIHHGKLKLGSWWSVVCKRGKIEHAKGAKVSEMEMVEFGEEEEHIEVWWNEKAWKGKGSEGEVGIIKPNLVEWKGKGKWSWCVC